MMLLFTLNYCIYREVFEFYQLCSFNFNLILQKYLIGTFLITSLDFRQRSTCSRCYLDEIGDMTPQKVCIMKKPQTPMTDTNSYGLKVTPAKVKMSGDKNDIFMSPNIIVKQQNATPKMVISKKRLSASRVIQFY